MSEPTLYERIGSLDGLQAVVKSFYKEAYISDQVGHFFQNVDMEDLIDHQMNFLRHVLGDDIGYDGRGLELAHMHLDIKKADFDEVARLLSEAMDKEGVQTDVRDEILEILAGTEKLVVKE